MYNIVRYDSRLGQFIEETNDDGTLLSFRTADEAAIALLEAFRAHPEEQYKIEYNTKRRRQR